MDSQSLRAQIAGIDGNASVEACMRVYDTLRSLRVSGDALEIGSYKGRVTVSLARAQEHRKAFVYTIDSGLWGAREEFTRTLARTGTGAIVRSIRGDSRSVNIGWRRTLAFIMIDTDDTYTSVTADFVLWERFLAVGGVILFGSGDTPALQRFCADVLVASRRFDDIAVHESVLYATKKAETPRYARWYLFKVHVVYALYYFSKHALFVCVKKLCPRLVSRDYALKRIAHRCYERLVR